MSAPPAPDRPAAPLLPARPPALPLADEPHVDAWLDYERDARAVGAFEALRRRFPQLRFPIRTGISQDEAYRAATRRGASPPDDGEALALREPRRIQLEVVATIAGRVPIVTAEDRRDFVTLVQAFTERNEPVPVPDSMGACLVAGLNNWDRIARYRAAWERSRRDDEPDRSWADEFQRLIPQRALYQDRFILLSRGAYSGLPAQAAGVGEREWLERSLIVRREHECTHYFIYRLTGALPHSVMDELVADFVGLARAWGEYRPDLALAALGLERLPAYRAGGRLENYCGSLAIDSAAFAELAALTARAIEQLAAVDRAERAGICEVGRLARLVFALSRLDLRRCAQPGLVTRLERELHALDD